MPRVPKKAASLVVADHALRLVAKGNRAPRTKDLLKCLNQRAPRDPGQIAILLRTVRRRVEKDYGVCVCSVGASFYESERGPEGRIIRKSFFKAPPESEEDAKKCLPGGRLPNYKPNRVAGLYFPKSGRNDLVYETFSLKYARQGMAETVLNVGRIESGLKHKILSGSSAPRKLAGHWTEYFGEVFASVIERQIGKAMDRLIEANGQSSGSALVGVNKLDATDKSSGL